MAKQKVMVVDDDSNMLTIIETRLRHAGYEVELAGSGKEALSKLKGKPPKMIFLDIVMPEMDGYEVLHHLKNNRKTRSIPVVMITSKSEDRDVVKAITMGAKDYVVKPFSPGILVDKIKKATTKQKKKK